jgi:hypothetical protein
MPSVRAAGAAGRIGAGYRGPHVERTMSWRSGTAGSLVLSGIRNVCGPPIPACIVNESDSVVDCPGLMVV